MRRMVGNKYSMINEGHKASMTEVGKYTYVVHDHLIPDNYISSDNRLLPSFASLLVNSKF